ncbi:MAG: asparagine synthase (glutamine-hydrolyzing) [Bacillati bacterium ANGP1]|uniref:asparagine synthase (glutamine-hydrolyzing) n=1 Tax=Candidatus Segetimicrobium genomatis TaxID=2569760 RepID=A0A537IRM3_9BACT|nr:MAG: asparagine synthase (glutamine-hydrolyzing) [Terrabacteria group bacterium ANGP1]
MCGIAGQVALQRDRGVDLAAVRAMTRALAHRGPDGEGEYLAPAGRAALGHRRLSIIDLVSGGQPIFNEDRSIAVVLNGEIYNFASLRAALEKAGHRFTTRSDTEVIVHLYEDRGVDCVRELRGMFAFLLWDDRQGRLLAARDPIGKKPLYYVEQGGLLSFASEITALFQLPDLPWRLDPAAIDLYLSHSYIPSPATILDAVRKLPAAHLLVVERGAVTLSRYWSPPQETVALAADAEQRLVHALEEAVRLRLVADVPVGCFLSGGVDSSVVVALMSRLSSKPVCTFSIGFDREEYTELPHARRVAELFNTDHHEFVVKPDAAGVLPDLVASFGEPFGDASALPVWYVAQLARRHVTVALNGDGGDELFAGYPWYATGARLAAAAQWIPPLAQAVLRRDPARRWVHALPRRAAKGLDLASRDDAARFAALRRTLEEPVRAGLYTSQFAARVDGAALAYLEQTYRQVGARDLLQAMTLTDMTTYLPEDLLVKVDRATMAHALEARSPFLDTDVVELALTLPARLKRDGNGTKRIVKKLFGPLFPPGFLERPKMGFSLPVDEWLRGELRGRLEARLLTGALVDAGIVQPTMIRRLVSEHDAGRSRGSVLWTLLMLAEWFERFGGSARWS